MKETGVCITLVRRGVDMRIIALCSKDDKNAAVDVLRLLKTLRLSSAAYVVGEAWRYETRRLDELLAPASHVVAVLSPSSASSSWLPFVAGFSLGSERPLLLYRPVRDTPSHAYLAPFSLLTSLDGLSAVLEAEASEWQAVSDRRNARRELLELGVSFRGDSFAESVREGNAHAIDLFIRAGLPADTRDKKGVPLLCLAAREGLRGIVALLLEKGASIDLQSEDRGNSALMDAAAGARDDIVIDLLARGAALDLQSKDGQTALVLAVGKNNARVAEQLLEAGADPDLADKLGFSARKYGKLFHDPAMSSLFDRYPPRS